MGQFYNTWEVDEFVQAFNGDPILEPAAKYLADYRDIINENSDGWAYWQHGRKCSDTLAGLLGKAMEGKRYGFRTIAEQDAYKPPTRKDVENACKKIESFMRGHSELARIAPPVLADAVQVALF